MRVEIASVAKLKNALNLKWVNHEIVLRNEKKHEIHENADRYPRFEGKWCEMLKMLNSSWNAGK